MQIKLSFVFCPIILYCPVLDCIYRFLLFENFVDFLLMSFSLLYTYEHAAISFI